MVTRRTVLVAGGSLVTLTALGGCVGDDEDDDDERQPDDDDERQPDDDDGRDDDGRRNGDDEDDDDEPDPAEYTFEVEQFVYTTERARRHGAFTEKPDATFRDGEMVWVYIEVSNVTPVPDGPHLTTTWEFAAPDGEVLASTEETVRFPDDRLDELPNEGFVTQGIDTSVFEVPTSGEYTTTVSITDRGSGETVEGSRPVTVNRFEFDSVVFTDGEPEGVDEYEEKEDAAYAVGETVWVYLGVRNVPVDDSGKAVLEYTFEVEPPDGETWERVQRRERWERVREDEILLIWQGLRTYEDDPTGTYELRITVEDKVDGSQLQTTETFSLE